MKLVGPCVLGVVLAARLASGQPSASPALPRVAVSARTCDAAWSSDAVLFRLLRVELSASEEHVDVGADGSYGGFTIDACDLVHVLIAAHRPDGSVRERVVDLTDVAGTPRMQTLAIALADLWLNRGVVQARASASPSPAPAAAGVDRVASEPSVLAPSRPLWGVPTSLAIGPAGAWVASPSRFFGGLGATFASCFGRVPVVGFVLRISGLYSEANDPLGSIRLTVTAIGVGIGTERRIGDRFAAGASLELHGLLGFGQGNPIQGADAASSLDVLWDLTLALHARWHFAGPWFLQVEAGLSYVLRGVVERADDRLLIGWNGFMVPVGIGLGMDFGA